MSISRIQSAILAVLAAFIFTAPARSAEVIPLGSTWKYYVGSSNEPSTPTNLWRTIGFVDTSWADGGAPIGYDTGGTPGPAPIVTALPTSTNGNYVSLYFRKTFPLSGVAGIAALNLTLHVDDGCVAWINGVEVARVNVPEGELGRLSFATVADETRVVDLTLTGLGGVLVNGDNVLAVHALNGNFSSSDLVFNAALSSVVDESPPTMQQVLPLPGSTILALGNISVVFDEDVVGVNAADLVLNTTQPATSVTVVNAREYNFAFPEPPTGAVNVAWAVGHGITDLAPGANAFLGGSWSYTLNPNAMPPVALISEFMADNDTGIEDEDGARSDWVELYNSGTVDLNLNGWFLTHTSTNLTQWRFPGVNLAPNRYLLVFASEKNKTNPFGPYLHTDFNLEKSGGYLALVDPQTNIISEFNPYPGQISDVSFGRDRANPELTGYFVAPTPGAQNSTNGAGFAPEPALSLASGIYTNATLTLTMTVPPGTTVRYTVNGAVPTASSLAYSAPIVFGTNVQIKARAFPSNPALWPSAVVGRDFILLDDTTRDFNSNLPILVLSTPGLAITANVPSGGTRVSGTFVSVDTFRGRSSFQGRVDHIGPGQFEVVGQTSAGFPKQPHRIELNDVLGNDAGASILGMPSEADWNLRNPYSDKCLMNDFLGYELWEEMGHYSCRRHFVEVFVDRGGSGNAGKLNYSDYYGVLVLLEHIESGKDRVDVKELTPQHTNAPSITGGYIFKKDKPPADGAPEPTFSTSGGAGFGGQELRWHEPKHRQVTIVQSNWLKNYLNLFEQSMYAASWTNATGTNHYSNYIDVDAFVDQHWHVEFTKQIDGYRLSGYYSKDRNGKLRPDPVWDWNLSFGNADYLQGGLTNSWYWTQLGTGDHIWLRRLIAGNGGSAPIGDPEFNQKIVDRWAVLRTNALSGPRVVNRIQQLANQLSEAAGRDFVRFPRLGTYVWPNPSTPANHIDYVRPTNYNSGASSIIIEMKKWMNGQYTWLDNAHFTPQPVFSQNGGTFSGTLNLTLTAPAGTIYYKLDGTDPRAPGGGVAAGALTYSGPIALSANARVFARVRHTSAWGWSAPTVHTFVKDTPKLVITEIMYHPAPLSGNTNDPDRFEFLEVRNIGMGSLDVGGFRLRGGVDFDFQSATLTAGERAVIVRDQAAFQARYGAGPRILGVYTNDNLANDGDSLRLEGSLREPIHDFSYDDDWHPITDGQGYSLVIVNDGAALDTWGLKSSWRPSGWSGGSPGSNDVALPAFPRVVINEALTHSDPLPAIDAIELRNMDATPSDISGWLLTDDFGNPKKYVFPPGTVIPGNDFLVVYETNFNAGPNGFALSSRGDEVYLYSADSNTNLTGYVHGFSFGAQFNGVTFGRHVISTSEEHFVMQTNATLGTANAGPKVGPIILTEINYRPVDLAFNYGVFDNADDEYIELRNTSGSAVPLFDTDNATNTWRLRDAVDYDFPQGITLGGNAYALVVGFDPANRTLSNQFAAAIRLPAGVRVFGPWDGKLDNSSESVELRAPDNPDTNGEVAYVLMDRVDYRDTAPWPVFADGYGATLQRKVESAYGNDPMNWAAAARSPGAAYGGGAPPFIMTQPASTNVTAMQSASLNVVPGGTGPFGYQWRFNGQPINDATNPSLMLVNITTNHAGNYSCVVMNPAGAVISSEALIQVLVLPSINAQPLGLNVRVRPDPSAAPATNALFGVNATSMNQPLTYQWLKNGTNIPGATGPSHTVMNVTIDDEGDYSCRVTDMIGSVSSANARLTPLVSPYVISPGLVSHVVITGAPVTFGVSVIGNPLPISFAWRRGSTTLTTTVVNARSDFFTVNAPMTLTNNQLYRVIPAQALAGGGSGSLGLIAATNYITTVIDSDGDGIPDFWESAYNATDPNGDGDGDKMKNRDEYLAGTDPTDSDSFLSVELVSVGGGATVRFGGVSNRTYTVQYTDRLAPSPWTPLMHVAPRPTNFTADIMDSGFTTNRFYRVATPQQQP